uniref:Uncharacterized protein AlNc14C199G8652 n=1 Tax=Albugo laibachii Nc14 TaxID=890382 RepID=F0WQI2_9STRA|nr:conserved hypothetical protein [Albugo laibachii Nc14]|eukprot:CCA23591.1 conserved hypothetical protein [Albugo laibachii Nc14]
MKDLKEYVESDVNGEESIEAIVSALYKEPEKSEQRAETSAKSSGSILKKELSADGGVKESELHSKAIPNKKDEIRKSVKAAKILKKTIPKEFWVEQDDTSLHPMPKLTKMPKPRPLLFWKGNRSFSIESAPKVSSPKPRNEKIVKIRSSPLGASKSSGEQLNKRKSRSIAQKDHSSKESGRGGSSLLKNPIQDPPPPYDRPEKIKSPIIKKSFHFDTPPCSPCKPLHDLTNSDDLGSFFKKATRFSKHRPQFDWDRISPLPNKRREEFLARLSEAETPHKFRDDEEPLPERKSANHIDFCRSSLRMNEISEEEHAKRTDSLNSVSLHNIVSRIDENLACVLWPFEKRHATIQAHQPSITSEESRSPISPNKADKMTTKQIIESLTDAFSELDSQHQRYLREEKENIPRDNEANLKKTLVNKKEDPFKQTNEDESIADIEGLLVTSSSEIESVLYRLELAEAESFHRYCSNEKIDGESHPEPRAPTNAVEASLKALGCKVRQKTNDIELRVAKASTNYSHLCSLEAPPPIPNPDLEILPIQDLFSLGSSFADVLRCEIIEKLDWTMCKLRHALKLDQKEQAEKEVERLLQEKSQMLQIRERKDKEAAKSELMKQATRARQRVMGKSSLDEISDWTLEERELLLKYEMAPHRSSGYEAFESKELEYEANTAWMRPRIDPTFCAMRSPSVNAEMLQRTSEKSPLKQLEWLQKNRVDKAEWLAMTLQRN